LVHRKVGDEVRAGDVVFTVKANDPKRLEAALQKLERAFEISHEKRESGPLILGWID
jgi:pyrimidine-nucleoside phosphorylase